MSGVMSLVNNLVTGSWFLATGFWCWVQGVGYWFLGTGYWVLVDCELPTANFFVI